MEDALGTYYGQGWLVLVHSSWTNENLIRAGQALGNLNPDELLTIGEGIDHNGRRVLRVTLMRESPEHLSVIQDYPLGMIQPTFWIESDSPKKSTHADQ
ncbi:hypothetical protein [Paenarthrobacter nitroguajacolicus]|uniref:hypothetical protein n=1 Tax=Paenarthrobacter nitroguajacolicus TaxID=211146 RepID=UPI002856066E|nr:hypothetical protein [Paenarthrobacter nitroguajacolicus]MDR6639615.1 hypothetical protein [Paenarthrobacter nitroguajacolicus]